MTRNPIWVVVCVLGMVAACANDSNRGGGRDGGGGITLMDGAVGGADGGTSPGGDGGGGRECEQPIAAFPATLAPRCTAATKSCIENDCAGMGAMCVNNCIAADTEPALVDPEDPTAQLDCGLCVAFSQFYCLDRMGCHDEVAAFFCCLSDCPDQACVDRECTDEGDALDTCAGTAPPCIGTPTVGDYAVCFP